LNALPNVTQNRSCHEKCRTARIYVIVRDGTPKITKQIETHANLRRRQTKTPARRPGFLNDFEFS
jgi:hypothetical protein